VMAPEVLETLIQKALDRAGMAPCIFSWQGGEPLLAGLPFYRTAVEFQKKHGHSGQVVGNSLQTNGLLLNSEWMDFFKEYKFFVGISLDGPERMHDIYRQYPDGRGSFQDVMKSVRLLKDNEVEFNILCTVAKKAAGSPKETYDFFLSEGLNHLQFIPAVDRRAGRLADFSVTPDLYGDFLCGLFDVWWNNGVPLTSMRFFDNIIEASIGLEISTCTMKNRCGDCLVVESNGDVYPCDFFVGKKWLLGNIMTHTLKDLEISSAVFGAQKAVAPERCRKCEWKAVCNNGCLWFRWAQREIMEDVDYFCPAYRQFFKRCFSRLELLATIYLSGNKAEDGQNK